MNVIRHTDAGFSRRLGKLAAASSLFDPGVEERTRAILESVRTRGDVALLELTKQFEEIATISAEGFPAWLAQDANRLRGEFVLVLHPAPAAAHSGPDSRVLELLLPHLPLKTAVKLAADITGEPRNALYELALSLKKD